MAHLANLEYELLKVTAGYRLLLVYSLVRKGPTNMVPLVKKTTGTSNVFNLEIIDKMYSHLLRTTHLQKSLSILLENEYTVTEIRTSGSDALKGIILINKIDRKGLVIAGNLCSSHGNQRLILRSVNKYKY